MQDAEVGHWLFVLLKSLLQKEMVDLQCLGASPRQPSVSCSLTQCCAFVWVWAVPECEGFCSIGGLLKPRAQALSPRVMAGGIKAVAGGIKAMAGGIKAMGGGIKAPCSPRARVRFGTPWGGDKCPFPLTAQSVFITI